MPERTSRLSSASNAERTTCEEWSSASSVAISRLSSSSAPSRSPFSLPEKIVECRRPSTMEATFSTRSSPATGSRFGVIFGLAATAISSRWKPIMAWFVSCPSLTALTMTSSGTSFAPASTIAMASPVPATTRSSLLSSNCANVGLTTSSPSTYPSLVAATGPSNGISDRHRAEDAPMMPRTSGSFSWSADRTVTMTWISLWKPFGKRGRRGRSVRRAARVATSVGRPSLRKKLPGILPAAYRRSS